MVRGKEGEEGVDLLVGEGKVLCECGVWWGEVGGDSYMGVV